MAAIRVLIADDSITVRKRIVAALLADGTFKVVGEAGDGATAIELCRLRRPDVITMDVLMPAIDGVAATEFIMARCPTPILVVSSSSNRDQVRLTFDALAAGAVDVLAKPSGSQPIGVWERELVAALKMAARIRPIIRPIARARAEDVDLPADSSPPLAPPPAMPPDLAAALPDSVHADPSTLAIGASTGGPAAVLTILSQIPRDFPLSILLVIHIAPEFANGLVHWLAMLSKVSVRVAVDGEPLPPPSRRTVLMAPPDCHLIVRSGRMGVTTSPQRHSNRPSVDVLFESVARECGPRGIACLLTGMGKDGANGLLAVRRSGGQTLAQDQATSTVFGMPRAAIALNAAQVVAPLANIAGTLCQMARRRRGDDQWP